MDTVTIDRSYPGVGDDGGLTASRSTRNCRNAPGRTASAAAFEHAYRTFRDPKFAWALAQDPSWQPSADFPFTRAADRERRGPLAR